jgi:hypothetical protein
MFFEDNEDNEDNIADYYEMTENKILTDQKRLASYTELFFNWNLLGTKAPTHIYTYFGLNHTLENMLRIFEENELYEKCVIVRDWIAEINQLNQIKINKKPFLYQ